MSVVDSSDLIGRAPGGRKLIAVVYADMVGYSRLIGLDDLGTLERLRTLRANLIDPEINEHGGRIVQTGGDSLLIVFDSIDGAVRCAIAIQQHVPDYDGNCSPDRAIRFRVGVNIGDVIADGTDLHGDGVNIAARLQAECPPGGICVSRAVRDHVHGRLDLAFDELGHLSLKNIARPVEAFVLRFGDTAKPETVEPTVTPGKTDALPLPDRPSIAVLAFANMSGDPAQEYFSDGVADDIITELSRSRSLFVIARTSSFTYKDRALNIKQVARELGVRYVVNGSLRWSGESVRITAQLIDAETGHHLWAERYDCDATTKLFAIQDCITTAVTSAIQPAIEDAEIKRVLRKPPESLGAWELYQRGLWHAAKSDAAENERAIEFFHRAIEQDETFVAPYLHLALAYRRAGQIDTTRPLEEAIRLAGEWTHKAAEIDPRDPSVQVALGFVAHHSGRLEEAWECASLALAANPNSAGAITLKGALLVFNGQPVEGRNALLTAARLDPRSHRANASLWSIITLSYYLAGDYAGAANTARQAIARYPLARFPGTARLYRWLAASLGQLGRLDEARAALDTALTTSPDAFDQVVRNRVPWHRAEDYEHMLAGLRKAGWRD